MKRSLVEEIKNLFPSPQELQYRMIQCQSLTLDILFLPAVCDEKIIDQKIILPSLSCEGSQDRLLQVFTAFGAEESKDIQRLPLAMTCGSVAIVINEERILAINAAREFNSDSQDVTTENTVLGPQKAFSENTISNVSIIRSRYPRTELIVEKHKIGELSHSNLVLLYDQAFVEPQVLQEVRTRLASLKVDMVMSVGQLELLLNKKKHSLFPNMMITERPDRVALNLSLGKVVLMLEGTPFALVLPAVFFDFMSAMDDLYQSFWISRFLVFLRYVSLFLTITLPALYISIVSFSPEIPRLQFTLTIAGSRAGVPYPSLFEVLIMMLMIEALTEASLRLPKYIGSTATTVGGLILGQAAQQAGLVSSVMIIVTSVVAISNFVIPINAMSFAMRVVKYPLIGLSVFFGIIGTVIGLLLLIAYLTKLRSFGEPYLRLYYREKNVTEAKPGAVKS